MGIEMITAYERQFIEKLIRSLSKQENTQEDQLLITSLTKKWLQPGRAPLNQQELTYLTEKLVYKLEDACDCRNEQEINFILQVMNKLQNRQ